LDQMADFSFHAKQRRWRTFVGGLASPSSKKHVSTISVLPIDDFYSGPASPGLDILDAAVAIRTQSRQIKQPKKSVRASLGALRTVFRFAHFENDEDDDSSSIRSNEDALNSPSRHPSGAAPFKSKISSQAAILVAKLLAPSVDTLDESLSPGSPRMKPHDSNSSWSNSEGMGIYQQIHPVLDADAVGDHGQVAVAVEIAASLSSPSSVGGAEVNQIGLVLADDNNSPVVQLAPMPENNILERAITPADALFGSFGRPTSASVASSRYKRTLQDYVATGLDLKGDDESVVLTAVAQDDAAPDSQESINLDIVTQPPKSMKKRLDWSNITAAGWGGTSNIEYTSPDKNSAVPKSTHLSHFNSKKNNIFISRREPDSSSSPTATDLDLPVPEQFPAIPAPVVTWHLPLEDDDTDDAVAEAQAKALGIGTFDGLPLSPHPSNSGGPRGVLNRLASRGAMRGEATYGLDEK
jgi:hypothetical protein